MLTALLWLFVATHPTGDVEVRHYPTERACEWGRAWLVAQTPGLDASPCGSLTVALEFGRDPGQLKGLPPQGPRVPGPR